MKLKYFDRDEFYRNDIDWFPKMNQELLYKLDVLRSIWGAPIHISKNPLAIGRFKDECRPRSDHNYDRWGEVRAVDVFPGYKGSGIHFYKLAKDCLFHGIGYYPDWEMADLKGGFHLGIRYGKDHGTWGYVDGNMVSIEEALNV